MPTNMHTCTHAHTHAHMQAYTHHFPLDYPEPYSPSPQTLLPSLFPLSTLTVSDLLPRLRPWSRRSALRVDSGLAYSQKPNACNFPAVPCTRFQLFILPHFWRGERTITSSCSVLGSNFEYKSFGSLNDLPSHSGLIKITSSHLCPFRYPLIPQLS